MTTYSTADSYLVSGTGAAQLADLKTIMGFDVDAGDIFTIPVMSPNMAVWSGQNYTYGNLSSLVRKLGTVLNTDLFKSGETDEIGRAHV